MNKKPLTKRNYTKKNCYLCNSQKNFRRPGLVRDNRKLKILECEVCGLVFLSSTKHITDSHYKNSGMHNDKKLDVKSWLNQTKYDDLRRFNFFKKKFKNKSVIDFGCGAGGFLKLVSKVAKEAAGIEHELAMQASYAERNLNVYNDYKPAVQSKKKWNILTAFHVVEHLPDPIKVLRALSKLLTKNGEMIIEVPNANDALLTLYKNKAFQKFTYWSQHLYLFNSNNLKELANQSKLKVKWIKHVQRYPLANHLYWLSKGKPAGHKVWSFLNDLKLNQKYENQLSLHGMTDTILICLKIKH